VSTDQIFNSLFRYPYKSSSSLFSNNLQNTHDYTFLNLYPHPTFRVVNTKYLFLAKSNLFFKENVLPWVYINLIQCVEFCSGRRALFHIYSFMNQSIDSKYVVLYKRWIPRLFYYERKLGHRFFLEEALHILHMSFNYHDAKLLSS
jgi:hypothetical protein